MPFKAVCIISHQFYGIEINENGKKEKSYKYYFIIKLNL